MKILWAPWRMKYILEESGEKSKDCLFCPRIQEDRDQENLILHRGNRTVVFMNKYPYAGGHLLVLPLRHVPGLDDLGEEELFELFDTVRLCLRVLDQAMKPDGYNVGLNLGKVAGAGVPGHLHVHIVPRWEGDHNFVSVLGETRVISEALAETYKKLAPLFKSLAK